MTQNKKRRNRKGFTLIELIVVIAILAILAAIAIPAFMGQLKNAKIKSHEANVAILRSAAQIALAENGAGAFTWNAASITNNTTDGGVYDADKYLDTWPANPYLATAVYSVSVDADGYVTVTPASGAYS